MNIVLKQILFLILPGVNRPENQEDFMKGNFGFASQLLDTLKKHNNKAGIMLSSSVQLH